MSNTYASADDTDYQASVVHCEASEVFIASLSSMQRHQTFVVPTGSPLPKKKYNELDLSTLCEEDFKSMKNDDPFMYFSIPRVRRSEVLLRDVDYADVKPTPLNDSSSSSTKVPRRSRLTMEFYIDVIMNDWLKDFDDEDDELNGLDRLDKDNGIDDWISKRLNADCVQHPGETADDADTTRR
jgi:hypothetical protein